MTETDMADKKKRFACPSCGDERHLYQSGDFRWSPEAGAWLDQGSDGTVECTSCDWEGPSADTEVGEE
jgi:predicted RNA-binding Zn-ribbon protein involved in translation (DUF1610 family)